MPNRFCLRMAVIALMVLTACSGMYGQLSGIKTVGGTSPDYATLELAIADLNTLGVGTGGVIFNVAVNHTETFTSPTAGVITATGTSANPILFQKSGTGTNPLITAGVGTGILDGIIKITGGDYITFDAIDLTENSANTTSTQQMEWGYALLKKNSAAPFDGCQYVTIKNCSITLNKANTSSHGIYAANHTAAASASLVITNALDANSNCKFFGNTISNVYIGIRTAGYAASTPFDLYDQNNEIGVDGGNNITNYGGAGTTTYGIYAIYQNNLKIANNNINGGTGQTTTTYGIFTSTGNNSNVDIYGNTVTVNSNAATSALYGISNAMGGSGTNNTVNIYNNILENCAYLTATTGTFYGIYNSAAVLNINMFGNIVRNNTKSGTGAWYVFYSSNTAASGVENLYNNSVYGNVNTGAATVYCLYSYPVSTTVKSIHNNNVYNNSTAGGTIYGMYNSSGATIDIYKNSVYNLRSTGSGGVVHGLYISSGATVYAYNNFVSDLKAPDATGANAINGIYVSGGTATSLYFNTVFLNAVSTSATTFGTSGIYASSTPTVELRNNIIDNISTPGPTGGFTVAFRRSSTTLTSYASTSNSNDFYAGTPGPANLIFYDGTNADQTIADFKARVSPRDANSFTENPAFVNISTPPYDLHINTATPTQLERGGFAVTTPINVTDDFDGEIRDTVPDVGADEFPGTGLDLTPPTIAYTPLYHTNNMISVTITATITDASGVASGANLPRLYIKKNSDVSYIFDSNPVIAGNDYTFLINYSSLSGVVIGDTLFYYVAAQDTFGNTATNPVGGSGINPPGTVPPGNPNYYFIVDAPLSGVYTIGLTSFREKTGRNVYFQTVSKQVVKNIRSADSETDINALIQPDKNGNVNQLNIPDEVTVTQYEQVLMENGRPFDLNFFKSQESMASYPTITTAVNDMILRGISGPVTFQLIDTLYANETYPIDISQVNGSSAVNTITIKPAPGIKTVIPGSVTQTTATFRLGGGDYVILDGSNSTGGITKDMTIIGLAAGTIPSIHLYSGASNNLFKNLIVESQNSSTGSGTFLFGAGAACDNNLVENCDIKTIDTAVVKHAVGFYIFSTATGSNIQLKNSNIYDFTDYGLRLQGAPAPNILVSGCNIYQNIPSAKTTIHGIYITRAPGMIIENNYISKLQSTGNATIRGIYYYGASGVPTDVTIRNNVFSFDAETTQPGATFYGIDYYAYDVNSAEIYYNTIYIGGTDVTGGSSYALAKRDAALIFKAFNNACYNHRSNGTGTGKHYAVYMSNTTVTTLQMNNNEYYTDGNGGLLGYYGSTADTTLLAWQTASGQDANSISAPPQFISSTDYRPFESSPLLNAGIPIAGITTDILGAARNLTTPTIGAYEMPVYIPLHGTYTVGLTAFKEKTGKNIYFEKRTRTAVKDRLSIESELDINSIDKEGKKENYDRFISVTEDYMEIMENGHPLDRSIFNNEKLGVYPTISAAVADLNLKGVSDYVVFSLVDTVYPNETYPIDIDTVVGGSSANTVTFKPAAGVQTVIPGSTTQTTATFRLQGSSYIIVDGSNTSGGTTKDMTIIGLAAGTYPSVHLYGAASNNIFKNLIIQSKNNSTGSGTFLFGAGPFACDNNVIDNCDITMIDTATVKPSVGVYFFSSNTGANNKILNSRIFDWSDYGLRLQGAPAPNILVSGNRIYHNTASTKSTIYGMYIGRAPGLLIDKNYIYNLVSTVASPTIEGIYYIGSSGNAMDVMIYNNVISLSSETNLPAGTLRGIDYYGFTANSVDIAFNTIYINGTGVTGGSSYNLVKRDAATTYKAYDNAVYNHRTNGTGTGSHYAVYLSNIVFTTLELNNNDYFSDGTGSVLGYYGTSACSTLAAWIAASSRDSSSISAEPLFVSNLNDYRPQIGSPLIGAGLPIAGITTDILGATRGTPPTIGAYEEGIATAINAPSGLIALADTFSVTLTWFDNSNNEAGFKIERKLGDTLSVNPFVLIDSVLVNVTSYIDTGLVPNTDYCYRVYAYNSGGNSGYSNIAQTKTIIPVELTSFTANQNGTNVNILWSTATETNNKGFQIERKLNEKAGWETLSFVEGKGTTTETSEYSYSDNFKYKSVSGTISYRLKQLDFDGRYAYSNIVEVEVDFTPKEYALYQNYPNPFNPSTKIKYALPFTSNVKISIYNMLGECLGEILNITQDAGYYDVNWNGANLASGIYFYTIEAKSLDGKNSFNSVKKMMMLK